MDEAGGRREDGGGRVEEAGWSANLGIDEMAAFVEVLSHLPSDHCVWQHQQSIQPRYGNT